MARDTLHAPRKSELTSTSARLLTTYLPLTTYYLRACAIVVLIVSIVAAAIAWSGLGIGYVSIVAAAIACSARDAAYIDPPHHH